MFQVIPLLVGFTGGQVHLIDPVHKVGLRVATDTELAGYPAAGYPVWPDIWLNS